MAPTDVRMPDGGHPGEIALAHGEAVTRALLGVDAIYREESGDEVGLVVLDMDTERRYEPEPFDSYADARRRWEVLWREAARLSEPDRRRYYRQLAGSTIAFIAWREEGLRFERQLTGFLHVPGGPIADRELGDLRRAIGAGLTALGYGGSLARQCAEWEAATRVPADEVAGVLGELMDEAWSRTEERLLEIPASRDDAMRVETVSGAAFNARCNYAVRRVEINIDPVLTRPALKHLAVHEGCPGHYVQFKLRETMARAGEATADVLLSVVNTASSSVFEGIADTGLSMLDWEDDDDRVQSLLGRYRTAIATVAAWRLHALGHHAADVKDWLAERALTGGDGWVENRMAFISAPERAVLIWSYWYGEPAVRAAWERVEPGDQPAFLRYLYGRMHSLETVSAFPDLAARERR